MIQDNVSQNTTLVLCGGSQVNDNMFRPLFILTRSSSGQTTFDVMMT